MDKYECRIKQAPERPTRRRRGAPPARLAYCRYHRVADDARTGLPASLRTVLGRGKKKLPGAEIVVNGRVGRHVRSPLAEIEAAFAVDEKTT